MQRFVHTHWWITRQQDLEQNHYFWPMNFIKRLFCILTLLIGAPSVFAQDIPTLPEVLAITKEGINILSWNNPYEKGVKTIAVQRSADSNYNFATIGVPSKIAGGIASFVDPHPLAGKNWYRLIVTFESGIDFNSNLVLLKVDSADIARQKTLPSTAEVQKAVNQNEEHPKDVVNEVIKEVATASLPKSRYVYTNPFSGNINIEFPDALVNSYQIDFFDVNRKKVLTIPRVNDKVVILDKRNFNALGIYQFTILKNKKEFERGYVTIY